MKSIKSLFPGLVLSAIAMLGMTACDDSAIEQELPSKFNVKTVNAVVKDFVSDEASDTRTVYTSTTNGYLFGWSNGDTIGIKAVDLGSANETTPQIYMSVNDENKSGKKQVSFDGQYFNLRSDVDYVAYYPYNDNYSKDTFKNSGAPISYDGQFQTENNSMSHISRYDYLITQAQRADKNGNLNFEFQHVGGLVTFDLTLPDAYKSKVFTHLNVYLFRNSTQRKMITGGLLSLDENSWVEQTSADRFTVGLNNLSPDTNGKLIINAMMAPYNYVSGTSYYFKIELVDSEGYQYSPISNIKAVNITPGSYTIIKTTVSGMSMTSEATMINGRDFNIAIRRALDLGNQTADYAERFQEFGESLVWHVVFEEGLPDDNYNIDLTDPTSFNVVKARYIFNEKCLHIRSSAQKIKINDASFMFYGFVKLTTIEGLQVLDTSKATSMANMFESCSSLVNLDLSDLDTSNVTDMSSMFNYCHKLQSVKINKSKFKTSNVTDMNSMFFRCNELKSFDENGEYMDLSGFNTAKVTDMRRMFSYCSMTQKIDISSFNVSNVKEMRHMFSNCVSLVTIMLPVVFDTSNVEFMDSMFDSCTYLESVDLKNSLTPKVKSFDEMFFNCLSIKNIDLRSATFDSCVSAIGMFENVKTVTSINIGSIDITGKSVDVNKMFSSTGSNAYVITFDLYVSPNFKTYLESDDGKSTTRLQKQNMIVWTPSAS